MPNKGQLFCFTYAGGTAAFFEKIEKELPELEVVKLEYSGHGARHKEPFYQDFDELAEEMFKSFKERLAEENYALFGYSMGCISLVEVLKRIISEGISKPSSLFLAAHEPYTRTEILGFSEDELDDKVIERTVSFGALPEKLLSNKVFWRTYLPIFRADYTMIGKYRFEELNLREDIPTSVFYSETDTPLQKMKQWESYFPCEFFELPGSHFFIIEHYQEMARIIRQKMGFLQ